MPRTTHALLVFFFLISASSFAQEIFIIEGDTLELKREVRGDLSLYYSQSKDSSMRYFLQKGPRMGELKNESVDGVPQFRSQLREFSSDARISTSEVEFTLPSLRDFTMNYNSRVQDAGLDESLADGIQTRLGFFTGFSNKVYVDNPDNTVVPIIGVEFEVYDPAFAPRHSAFLHLRHSFERDEFRYSSTELSVNYRFKLIQLTNVSFHIDAELATLSYFREQTEITDDAGQVTDIRDDNGFSVKAPLSFGIGSAIRITDKSFITVGYNDVVSLFLDSNGNFPVDISIGYKYEL